MDTSSSGCSDPRRCPPRSPCGGAWTAVPPGRSGDDVTGPGSDPVIAPVTDPVTANGGTVTFAAAGESIWGCGAVATRALAGRGQMAARGRMTIREVAEAAGVSTQTVSRVLNNRPDVAPETFERVRRVIAATGYAPNMVARSLTQGRSQTLGVVAYGLDYFGPSRILTGIDQQAAESGYSISLNLIHEPATGDVDEVLLGLIGRQVDGIIWAIPEVGDNRAWSQHRDLNLPVPVILVGCVTGKPSLPSIGDRQPGHRPAGDRAPDRGRRAADRHRHRPPRLVGGAAAPRRVARDARCGRRPGAGPDRARGRLDRGQRRGGPGPHARRDAGRRRRVREQRPDGRRRAPRRPSPWPPDPGRPRGGRRRRHRPSRRTSGRRSRPCTSRSARRARSRWSWSTGRSSPTRAAGSRQPSCRR